MIQASVLTLPSTPAPAPGDGPLGALEGRPDGADPAADTQAQPAEEPSPPAPCPPEMALIGKYCVDRWEGHLVVEGGDPATGQELVHPYSQRPEAGVRYAARSAPDVYPQAFISRVESKAACVASGKRLCSRQEWMQACRGRGTYRYPYAQRGERGKCSTGKPHLLSALFGAKGRGWTYDDFNSPKLALEPGYLAKTAEYEGCASELGVHDMVGNLHEWVSDSVDQHFVDRLAEEIERRSQPWHEGNGVFMGGFFSTTNELGPGCYYTTIAHEPAYHDYSTGFRCCADATLPPEPEKPTAGKGKTSKRPQTAPVEDAVAAAARRGS
ncbi:SUMF1/EgtB/PvdO family nonheme iron enzyme [Chondromyces crocatus]|uniref:Sulfatase-modifying factor enzyme-like domain-containing protein n=1 Tax=Chondromyces crocatus TaxID=52 RepID=A0A0K1ETI5_CHOCO|nr:SUMF1/EgtB/PvdO family nonheme iron enzyme [Chondromyces crocatus]AKT44166.1 uncharacterized protein CMC5_084060 [Chondromyces crocatus]